MALSIQKCLLTFGTIGAFAEVSGGWILRRERRLTRIDLGFSIIWNIEFPEDQTATIMRVAVVEGVVITYRAIQNGSSFLAGYEQSSGKELWQLSFEWPGLNSYGGLITYGRRLFVAGDPSRGGAMLIIEPQTGAVLDQIEKPPIDPKGPLQDTGYQGLVLVGKWLFSRFMNKQFYRADLSTSRPEFELLQGMEWSNAGTKDGHLFWSGVKDGKAQSLRIDPGTMEITHSVDLSPINPPKFLAKKIIPTNERQALLMGEDGIAYLDYFEGKVLWKRQASDIGKSLSGGFLSPAGLVLLRQAKENPLLVLDAIKGKTIQTIQDKELHLHGSIFNVGDWVVANDIKGIVLLKSTENQTAPAPLDWIPFESDIDSNVETQSSQSPPTFTPTDQQYSAIITAFVNAKAAQEQGRDADHERLAAEFNKLFDAFAQAHPEVSIANIARTLSELGVPYEVTLGDVVRMRG